MQQRLNQRSLRSSKHSGRFGTAPVRTALLATAALVSLGSVAVAAAPAPVAVAALQAPNPASPATNAAELAERAAETAKLLKLGKGDIIVKSVKVKGARVPEFTVSGVVNAPLDAVWKVVSDCDNYESVMPRVEAASVVKRKGNLSHCKVRVDLPFPLSHLDSVTAVTVGKPQVDGARRMSWRLVKGDYRRHEGQWTLSSFGPKDSGRTLVVYTVLVDPKLAVPPGLLRRSQAKEFPGVIKGIRAKTASNAKKP